MKISECKVGFIGFGAMLQAIYRAIDSSKLIPPSNLLFVQRDSDRAKENQKKFGILSSSLENLVKTSQLLILGVRPVDVEPILKKLSSLDLEGKMVLTVVAGRRFEVYQKYLKGEIPLIRAMPNTASSIRAGMTVLSMGPYANSDFQSLARILFGSLGEVIEVEESLMDIGCAIAGSGPGFVFRLIEAMARAGEKEGLDYSQALKMAAQTFCGASQMILQGKNPLELIHEIATPGGTTEAGFQMMNETALENSFQKTIHSAMLQSKKLSR